MGLKLKEIFTASDKVQQTYTINAWHVSQSVDALTGAEDYDITISGSLTVTGSILHNGIQNANGAASSVLVRDNSTGEYYITGSYGGGIDGTSGTSGAAGGDGTSGTSGAGTSGTSGAAGGDGTSGTSGASGNDGTSGTSGAGTSGTTGASGDDGTSGTSGATGGTGTSGTSGGNSLSRPTTTTHAFDVNVTNDSDYTWQLEQGSGTPSANGRMRAGMTGTSIQASAVTSFYFDRDSSTGNRDNTLDYIQTDGSIKLRNTSGTLIADDWTIKEVDTSNSAYVRVYVDWNGGSVALNNNTQYRVDFVSSARIQLDDAGLSNITLQNQNSSAVNVDLVPHPDASFGDLNVVELKTNASNGGICTIRYVRLSQGSGTTLNDYERAVTYNPGSANTVSVLTLDTANQKALLHFRVVNYGNNSLAYIGGDKVQG